MQDSFVLPLLAPNAQPRRQRGPTLGDLLRLITRRKLKFYIFFTILLLIICITYLHKVSKYNVDNTDHAWKNKRTRFEARTMRTIIGRYVGPKLDIKHNLSDSVINANNYNPDPKMGKDGRPVYLPGYPKDQMQALYSINSFNLVVSDKISVDRKLPDARKLSCRKRHFNETELPTTSIIIVFHNEAWSTLARTVHSILNTSPNHLLKEILLVDDASNRTFLAKSLDNYMTNLSTLRGVEIRVLRSKHRIGLIRSRLFGVEAASGDVLTFIDAHCEATTGWLEPLLEQIKNNPKSAACPIIDIINEDTFAYVRSFELHMGAFNWGLNFRWYPISKRELIASNAYIRPDGKKTKLSELIHPFKTPIMAGGLFSIGREYFNQIGKYDPEMDIWGGENIELSLRLWQCGGEVRIVPCSHVAHIFRKSSPYTFRPGKEVGDILYTNLARLAEVWMDDWRDFFYAINPIVNKTMAKVGKSAAMTRIEDRIQLRKTLGCQNFDWFLKNIWPEHFFPHESRFFGKLKLKHSGRCLQRTIVRQGSGQAPVGPLSSVNCTNRLVPHQLFIYNDKTNYLMSDENVCLDSGSDPMPSRQVILAPCSETQRQKWIYNEQTNLLKHEKSSLCLSSHKPERVQLENCDENNESMQWVLHPESWHR